MDDLRAQLIRLAFEQPDLRDDLLPLVKTSAKLDVYSKWSDIVRKHELAEAKDMEDLLKTLVPYLKSAGFDLDLKRSSLDKYHHGSDGWKLEGQLVLTEREENTYALEDSRKVVEWVERVTGLWGSAHPSRFGWIVNISE